MKLKLKINEHTTDSELIHLGNFFSALGLNRGAHVISAPADEAEYTVIVPPTNTTEQELRDGGLGKIDGINILTGKPEPKRRRRTKGEIESAEAGAAAAAAHAAAEAAAEAEERGQHAYDHARNQPDPEPEGPIEPGEPGNDQAAPTQPAQETGSGAAQTPATASPSSVPTPAELNTKAAAVAKKIGPEKIRDHIRELGGTLISTLSPDALVAFNDWLDQQ